MLIYTYNIFFGIIRGAISETNGVDEWLAQGRHDALPGILLKKEGPGPCSTE